MPLSASVDPHRRVADAEGAPAPDRVDELVSEDLNRGVAFNPADLAEDVDLDLERRKEILLAERNLATWTHYEALGLPWNADAAAARRAYLEKVKVFHPDRYAGKRLGSYRARLERIFRRITEARDVLNDDARRVQYARATAPALELAKLAARQLDEERRSDERRARLARQNPILARAGRIAELLKRGREAMASGDFQQAANDFQLVASLEPANKEAADLAAEARRRSHAVKVQECLDAGLAAETLGNWAKALRAYRAALEIEEGHLKASILACRAALQTGDANGARELAERAVAAAPRNGAAHEALGQALEAAGRTAQARKALQRAVELDPKLESARERLKKLRWSILG
jgi:curved DNA-binding protein CbpA